jgi:hypothetical protein
MLKVTLSKRNSKESKKDNRMQLKVKRERDIEMLRTRLKSTKESQFPKKLRTLRRSWRMLSRLNSSSKLIQIISRLPSTKT